jgi:uncharacterized protein YkwD
MTVATASRETRRHNTHRHITRRHITHRLSPRRVLGALALATVMLLAVACTPEQMAAIDLANSTRREAGLPELLPSPALIDKAQAWADELARRGSLSHSTLTAGVPDGWLKLGENVGKGPSIEAVHAGFLGSPAHYANLIDPSFNWIGTGVATASDGTIFVVQVFGHY